MKIAIFLGHPAHFHLFKHTAKILIEKGHQVEFVIKQKDILENLLMESKLSYKVIRKKERKTKTKLGLISSLLKMDLNMFFYLKKSRPNLLIGTYVAMLNKLAGVPLIVTNEDDANVVPYFALSSYPLADAILNPTTCDSGRWDKKAIKYKGYQKLAYLHPNQFKPDKSIVEKYFSTTIPYFIVRFSSLNAHHDNNVGGLTNEIANNIIKLLSSYGQVYITSERELEPQFEKYRITVNPLDMHHILAYTELFVGDSQSMAVEAAMLGVPSVRFSDFAGKISVLEELEHTYQLTYGIKTNTPQKLYDKINELLTTSHLREVFQQRRTKMLQDKIDVTAFLTWFIEEYPHSAKIMKENPDYQERFK